MGAPLSAGHLDVVGGATWIHWHANESMAKIQPGVRRWKVVRKS